MKVIESKHTTVTDVESNNDDQSQEMVVHESPLATLDVIPAEDFDVQVEHLKLWTSFTGPVPVNLKDYYNLKVIVIGMIRQTIEHTNEDTGVYRKWYEVRMKLVDGNIIAASGQGANQFADIVLPALGQGDWPIGVKVLVKARTLKNGHALPTFQILEKTALNK